MTTQYPLHPLITPGANQHYNTRLDGRNTILDLEMELTVSEAIGACKWNIYKYDTRAKGQDDADAQKADKYTEYLAELELLSIDGLASCRVAKAWTFVGKQWSYI